MLFCDAIPIDMNPALSPSQRHKPGGGNPMMGGRQGAVKGNIKKMLEEVGVDFPVDEVVWSTSNPYPDLDVPDEIPFSSSGNNEFSNHEVTSGLQVVVSMFPGHLKKAKDAWTTFTPLFSLNSGNHGTIKWNDLMIQGFMGQQQLGREPQYRHKRVKSSSPLNLGAHVKGTKKEGDKELKVDLMVFSDLDFISDRFFGMRSQGSFDFDNVTLVLNAIDFMADDKEFITLRKKRKNRHTLTKFDDLRKEQDAKMKKIIEEAEKNAKVELDKAQAILDKAVETVKAEKDLKPEEMARKLSTVQEQQSQAFSNKQEEIERKKNRRIKDAERDMNEAMKSHKNKVVTMAIIIPTLLPLIIALVVYFRRRSRETRNVSKNRMKGGA